MQECFSKIAKTWNEYCGDWMLSCVLNAEGYHSMGWKQNIAAGAAQRWKGWTKYA